MMQWFQRHAARLWQAVFLVVGTSWLLAPSLNHVLSYRSTLISQYETAGQPYAWLFRVGDVMAGLLLLLYVRLAASDDTDRWTRLLLYVTAIGTLLDPILTTSCVVKGATCTEPANFQSIVHGIETMFTVCAFLAVTLRDIYVRRSVPSIAMAILQLLYGALFFSQIGRDTFATLPQYIYQCSSLLWLAWFCVDRYGTTIQQTINRKISAVRWITAIGAAMAGLFAIVSSLSSTSLLNHVDSLYFAGRNDWLAHYGIIIGVTMLYLSRHVLRGEQRARQLILAILGIEVIRHALITPSLLATIVYGIGFVLLFTAAGDFQRGSNRLTWNVRMRDLTFLVSGLLMAAVLTLILLDRDDRASRITAQAFDHFGDYIFLHTPDTLHHRASVILVHTSGTFIAATILAVLWILFRPTRLPLKQDNRQVRRWLSTYSTSTEDYFKWWPRDKHYFWDDRRSGFIAYKVVGPVAFALADPIAPISDHARILTEFLTWTRSKRLRACFLLVSAASKTLYEDMRLVQSGASAVIDTQTFTTTTMRNKWWRWKINRATKQGYTYHHSEPPHSHEVIQGIKDVSDQWLNHGNHQERGFALGYFDTAYMQASVVHYLQNEAGNIVAFVNQLPQLRQLSMASIDLLRYMPNAQDSMPFLLSRVISQMNAAGYTSFDLGFVPFAATSGPLISIATTLSAGRFSAQGLQQFKNKFEPQWQPNYIAYDGDLADLALIALNLEKAMK